MSFSCFHDSEWFVHPLPRYLVLTGSEIINSFLQAKEADSDIIDAVIRCLCHLDANVESGGVPVRWRHFIETDFAVNYFMPAMLECLHLIYYCIFNIVSGCSSFFNHFLFR